MNLVVREMVIDAVTELIASVGKRALKTPSKLLTKATASAAAYVLTLILMNGWVGAQTPQAPTATAAPLATQTSDGRKFTELTDEDVKQLPFVERIRYKSWKLAELDKEAAERKVIRTQMDKEAAERKVRIAQMDKEAAEREVRIAQKEKEAAEREVRIAQMDKEALELQARIASEWIKAAATLRQLPPPMLNNYLRKDVPGMTKLLEYVVGQKFPEHEYAGQLLESLRAMK